MNIINRKIKILFVVSQLEIGGLELQVLELCRGLDKNVYEIFLCSVWPHMSLSDKFLEAGVEIVPIHSELKKDLLFVFKLRDFLIKEKIDIIHTWIFTANTRGRVSGILAKTPVIIGSERSLNKFKPSIYNIVDHILAKFSDVMIGNSQAVKDYMVGQQKIPDSKCKVIHNGVDSSRFAPTYIKKEDAKIKFSLPPSKLIVGTVANFTKSKDYPNFLKAASLVLEKNSSVHFVTCGSGYFEMQAINIAKELGISESITFLGKQTVISDVLATFDVFALASVSEGFSNAILEAMAFGLPVVVTDVGGARDVVVNGVNGFLVPPKNPELLASKIETLLEDQLERIHMGRRGAEVILEKFSINKMVSTYDELYQNLLLRKL